MNLIQNPHTIPQGKNNQKKAIHCTWVDVHAHTNTRMK